MVVAEDGEVTHRHKDLDLALRHAASSPPQNNEEWRIHFHVPLHEAPGGALEDTRDHVEGTLDILVETPSLCKHLEMETYTWEVLPEELRTGDVVEQIAREYEWSLAEFEKRGLGKD